MVKFAIHYIKLEKNHSQWKPKAYRMVGKSDNLRVIVILKESSF